MIKIDPRVKNVLEWIGCIIIAIIIALIFRHFIGTPTVVQQPSMKSTLMPNDRLYLNRWVSTIKGELKRGDIITFEAPSVRDIRPSDADLSNPVAIYNYNPTNFWEKFSYYFLENGKISFIKRIIGVAGDKIEIKDGKVYLNGNELHEDYLDEGQTTESEGGAFTDITVPEGYLFVMGDNRDESADSRRFGCIPIDRVEGRVVFRFWPLNKFGGV